MESEGCVDRAGITTSLGRVLPCSATWALGYGIPMAGKMVIGGGLRCEPVMGGAQGGGAVVARKMETLMKIFWLGQSLRTY